MSTFAIANARDHKDLRFKVVFDRDVTKTVREGCEATAGWVAFAGGTSIAASTTHYRQGTGCIQYARTGTATAVGGYGYIYATASDWSADTLRTIDWRTTSTSGIASMTMRLLAGTATGTNYHEWTWTAPFHCGWNAQTATCSSPTATSGSFSSTAVKQVIVFHTMSSTAAQPTIQIDNLCGIALGTALPVFTNGTIQNSTSTDQRTYIRKVGSMCGSVTPERGEAQVRSTVVELVDVAGAVTQMISTYEMRNRIATLSMGYSDVDESGFVPVFKGNVSSLSFKDGVWSFALGDLRRTLKKDVFTAATELAPVTFTGWNPIDLLLYIWCNGGGNGLAIDPSLIDWDGIYLVRDDYFSGLTMDFSLPEQEEAKAFTEGQLMLPLGCYIIVDGDGRLTLKHLRSPLLVEASGTVLDDSVIIGIPTVSWGLQDLINEIYWKVDYVPATGEYTTKTIYLSSTSLTQFQQTRRIDVESRGLDSGDAVAIAARNTRLFARFAEPYPRYKVKTKLSQCQIEEGSLIQLRHSSLPDTVSGSRGMASTHLVEVVSVNVNLDQGYCEFELIDTPWSFTRAVVISPTAMGDYDTATSTEHSTYGWIGRTSDNKVGAALDAGYVVQEG